MSESLFSLPHHRRGRPPLSAGVSSQLRGVLFALVLGTWVVGNASAASAQITTDSLMQIMRGWIAQSDQAVIAAVEHRKDSTFYTLTADARVSVDPGGFFRWRCFPDKNDLSRSFDPFTQPLACLPLAGGLGAIELGVAFQVDVVANVDIWPSGGGQGNLSKQIEAVYMLPFRPIGLGLAEPQLDQATVTFIDVADGTEVSGLTSDFTVAGGLAGLVLGPVGAGVGALVGFFVGLFVSSEIESWVEAQVRTALRVAGETMTAAVRGDADKVGKAFTSKAAALTVSSRTL